MCAEHGQVRATAAVLFAVSLLNSGALWAFQCPPDETEEVLVARATQVLLVRITATELVEVTEGGERFELPRSEYRLLEALKGTASDTGYVYDMPVGYGTGFVGLLPGVFYLLVLDQENSHDGVPFVDPCALPIATANLEGTQPRAILKRIRSYLTAAPAPPASGFAEGHGTWEVVGHSCPHICAMSDEEAASWLGKEARITASQVSFASEICTSPAFSRTTRTPMEFFRYWRADPAKLGIAQDTIVDVEVLCDGEPWTAPGSAFIITGKDRLLTSWDGVLFELSRRAP